VHPEILSAGSERYVRTLADRAACLREYLLRHGVPCAPLDQRWGIYQTFRLGKTANVQLVRSLLGRWAGEGQSPLLAAHSP
jgi:hypothetical protein